MSVFRLTLAVIILLLQTYLYIRVRTYIRTKTKLPHWVNYLVTFLFVIFNASLLYVAFNFFRIAHQLQDMLVLVNLFYIWHGATFFIALVLLCVSMIKLPFRTSFSVLKKHPKIKERMMLLQSTLEYQKFDASRRAFLEKSVIGLTAYAFVGASAGVIGADEYDVVEQIIAIPNLPEEFKGLTIGMMSDVHSSAMMNKEDMLAYVRAMNKLKTDLIVVTGDFVNSQTEEVYPFAEAFSELKADYGIYGCLGNHDYFTRNVDYVAKRIDDCGVKLLRNDAVKIQKGNSFINMLGVDDVERNADPDAYIVPALSAANNDAPKILLCHKPYYMDNFEKHNIDLTLSGHTHGGQVVFAKIGDMYITPATLFSKYVWGLYRQGGAQLYVNRGIGSVGLPFRVNCPPELTKITLT